MLVLNLQERSYSRNTGKSKGIVNKALAGMGRPGNKRLSQYLAVIALIILICYLKNYCLDLIRSGLLLAIELKGVRLCKQEN